MVSAPSFHKRLFFLAAIVLSCVWYLDDGVLEGKSLMPIRILQESIFLRAGVVRRPVQTDKSQNYLLGHFHTPSMQLLARANQSNG